MKKNQRPSSELRMDVISQDWVIIAPGRAGRPNLLAETKKRKTTPPKECPFCQIQTQQNPLLVFSNGRKIAWEKWTPSLLKKWTTLVIPNKYPIFSSDSQLKEKKEGPFFKKIKALGFHEIVVTRHHTKQIAQFNLAQVKELFDVYQERYLELMKKNFVNYISIFHNHGPRAGASVDHPHSQIITTLLIDIDLQHAIKKAQNYFEKYGKCIYCEMNKWEQKNKKRIVFENEEFLVLCPFASKVNFEVIITPKKHLSYFQEIKENEKWKLAQAFQIAIEKIFRGLNDPDYNFYLHTAPCDGKKYPYYHWHWTILPRLSLSPSAGFEMGTHMEVSTIFPEKAAEYLKNQ